MIRAKETLLRQLDLIPYSFGQTYLDELFAVVKHHRQEWRKRGVDFPVLVALVVPRLQIVELKRADLDMPSIRVSIVNFVRNHSMATMNEVVLAFRAAYPNLKPDDILGNFPKNKGT